MAKVSTVICLILGVAWSIGVCAQPGGDWWLVSDGERDALLFRPASFKRDGDMVSATVRIDHKQLVLAGDKEAAQLMVDAQGKPYTGTEHEWVINCRDRSFVTKRSTQIGVDGRRSETNSKGLPRNTRVEATPKESDIGLFFDAACRNLLAGVNVGPPPNGMLLFGMNPGYVLAVDPQGILRQGSRAEAIVRLTYRTATALPDGQRVAWTDAIWAMDCTTMQGAVVAEKKLAPDGKIVGELPRRTLAELKYTTPVSGGLPEAFQRAVCEDRIAAR